MATLPINSIVKEVQAAGTYNSQHGLLYKFEYTMQDGVTLVANHKSETGFFKVGSPVEYQIKSTNSYGNMGTVSKPKESAPSLQPNTNFSKTPEVQDMIIRQSSVKASIDWIVASGSNDSIESMLNKADIIFNYCKNGVIPSLKETKPF